MARAASGNLRPWIGSAIVHGLVVVALALAAIQWRTDPPSPQVAIEGNVVRYEDLPASVKAGSPIREPKPVAPVNQAPPPTPSPKPVPEPKSEPKIEPKVEPKPDPALRELKMQAEAKAKADTQAKAAAALADKKRAEADEKRKQEEARKAEAAAAKQTQADKDKAAREAKVKAAQEADRRRALEDEEAGEALAQSGVIDEYRTLLIQAIERNWNRPPSARAGLECTLYVTQATGGTVLDVKIGDCNGDQAVRESVSNAVYRSSPLPAPRDARAFQRKLVIVFKPTE